MYQPPLVNLSATVLAPSTTTSVSAATQASLRRGPVSSAAVTATDSASAVCLVRAAAASSAPAATAPRAPRMCRAAYNAPRLSARNSESTRPMSNQAPAVK